MGTYNAESFAIAFFFLLFLLVSVFGESGNFFLGMLHRLLPGCV